MCSAIWYVFNSTKGKNMAIHKINEYWALGAWVGSEFIVKALYKNYWSAAKGLLKSET